MTTEYIVGGWYNHGFVRTPEWNYIDRWNPGETFLELYDVRNDRLESSNVVYDHPALAADLRRKLMQYVAQGREHPALLCSTALLRTPHWLSPAHAAQLAAEGWLTCQYKARYGQQPRPCTVYPVDPAAAAAIAAAAAEAAAVGAPAAAGAAEAAGVAAVPAGSGQGQGTQQPPAATAEAAYSASEDAAAAAAERLGFRPSAFCRLQPEDTRTLPSYLVVRFDEPAAAITPQQAFVLYDGEQCLGAALIAQPGRSLHEEAAAAGTAQGSAAAAEG